MAEVGWVLPLWIMILGYWDTGVVEADFQIACHVRMEGGILFRALGMGNIFIHKVTTS